MLSSSILELGSAPASSSNLTTSGSGPGGTNSANARGVTPAAPMANGSAPRSSSACTDATVTSPSQNSTEHSLPQRSASTSAGGFVGDGCGVLVGVGGGEEVGGIVTVGNGVPVGPGECGGVSVGVLGGGVALGVTVGNAAVAGDAGGGVGGGSVRRSQAISPSMPRVSTIRKARRKEFVKE